MTDFIAAQVTTDADALVQTAIDSITQNLELNGYPGWTAAQSDFAVLVLKAISDIAADTATYAAVVLPAVFRAFGTKLINLPYGTGTAASVTSTWTFTSPAPAGGYLISGGTVVILNGLAFYVQSDVTTATSATSATVLLVASQTGTLYNNLGGVGGIGTLDTQFDWVSSVTTNALSAGGGDPETDDIYQDKLASALKLQAPRPIVATDFAGMVTNDIALAATGISVGRATAIDNYYPDGRPTTSISAPSAQTMTCAIASGSTRVFIKTPLAGFAPAVGATVTGTGMQVGTNVYADPTDPTTPNDSIFRLSLPAQTTNSSALLTISPLTAFLPAHLTAACTVASGSTTVVINTPPYYAAIPEANARVTGPGIQNGTIVASSPPPGSASFTLSAPASASAGNEIVTVSSWTNVSRSVATFVTNTAGQVLPSTSMDALQTWLLKYREATFNAFVGLPVYNTVYVTATVKVLPTFDQTAVAASVVSSIQSYLDPAQWGVSPQQSIGGWYNSAQGFNVIRYNKVIGVIENVPGVDYALTGSIGLTIGFSANPVGTSDITMQGAAPLPLAGIITVTPS